MYVAAIVKQFTAGRLALHHKQSDRCRKLGVLHMLRYHNTIQPQNKTDTIEQHFVNKQAILVSDTVTPCHAQSKQSNEVSIAAAGDLPTLFSRSPLRRLGALPSRQPGDSHSSCSWMTVLAAALPLRDTTCKPCPPQNSHSPSHIFSSLACIDTSTGPGQWNSFLQPSQLST